MRYGLFEWFSNPTRIRPMSAYGLYMEKIVHADALFEADKEQISEELLAALKRADLLGRAGEVECV